MNHEFRILNLESFPALPQSRVLGIRGLRQKNVRDDNLLYFAAVPSTRDCSEAKNIQ
jgi:hypothetical protein